ncbi:MAG: hypothetical protein ACYTGC_01925 [Planctomycetota bacterium]|jgi:hypothetical protein
MARIKLDADLYQRLVEAARRAGYASTDEFIRHVLERETARLEASATDEQVDQQLRGLGYIE